MSETAPAAPRDEATILHVDMDAFFLSVELRERPDLEGRPAAVAAPSGRSVVLSASYAARAYGVRSAMPLAHARALCPPLVVIPPRQQLYRAVSAEVMAVLADVTPVMEQLSVDEAFLDVAGAVRLMGAPATIAQRIRDTVADEQGITCSVGVASTKFVAKLASGLAKPDGLLVIPADEVVTFVQQLPVGALWGVGDKTEEALSRLGLRTVADIAHTPRQTLVRALVGGRVPVGAQRSDVLRATLHHRELLGDRVLVGALGLQVRGGEHLGHEPVVEEEAARGGDAVTQREVHMVLEGQEHGGLGELQVVDRAAVHAGPGPRPADRGVGGPHGPARVDQVQHGDSWWARRGDGVRISGSSRTAGPRPRSP